MFPHCKFTENDLHAFFKSATPAMVESALKSSQPTFSELLALLSPAAADAMAPMREKAARIKKMHFGKTVRLYSPLYLSNYCVNDCVYCGFRQSHNAERRRLTIEEALAEAEAIREFGIESLLLVSGEDPRAVSLDYLADLAKILKEKFAYVSIEIYPLDQAGYRKLFEAGIHGVTIYQETYQEDLYSELHPRGPKRDYHARLEAPENGARAGLHNIGIGALLGLYDWRIESVSLAAHGLWLRKHHWQSKINFSFPRITPTEGGFQAPAPMSAEELEQMMLAFRIFFQESDLYISTREDADFRNRVVKTCASHMSAASQVVPGGYCKLKNDDLGQFSVNDQSSVAAVKAQLEADGLEAVFKDWDSCLGA